MVLLKVKSRGRDKGSALQRARLPPYFLDNIVGYACLERVYKIPMPRICLLVISDGFVAAPMVDFQNRVKICVDFIVFRFVDM